MLFEKFTKQYSLSKTLRFELKPVGETADYIDEYRSDYIKSIVQGDTKRYDDYQRIKTLIDNLHRNYIDQRLSASQKELSPPVNMDTGELVITREDLYSAFCVFKALKKDTLDKTLQQEWKQQQKTLREKLASVFSDKAALFGKDLIAKTLPEFLEREGCWEGNQELVESFRKFTTYFTGFHENRKNMYDKADKATSIANRAINENLPKFFDNLTVFQNIQERHPKFKFFLSDQETLQSLGISDLSEAFLPEFYLKLFSQRGIEAYQNLLGGRASEDDIVNGLNKQINLYRQQNTELRPRDFPTFARLHKQILAEAASSSFSYEPYMTDQDMLADIKELMQELNTNETQGHFLSLQAIIENLKNCDTNLVFVRGNTINQLSNNWLGSYVLIERALDYFINESGRLGSKKDKESYKKRTKDQGYFSIEEVQSWIKHYLKDHDTEEAKVYHKAMQSNGQSLVDYFILAINKPLRQSEKSGTTPIGQLEHEVSALLELSQLNGNRHPPKTNDEDDKGGEGFHQVESIQKLLDGYMNYLNQFRPLHLVYKRKSMHMPADQDLGFYNEFANLFDLMMESAQLVYNKTRNHLSKKTFKTDKVKINFENPNLMNGWDVNKEKNNSCVLFEKDANYFLGIMHPEHRSKLFDYIVGIDDLGKPQILDKKNALKKKIVANIGGYRKVIYKQLPGASKMLPKVFFSESRIDYFAPSDEVLRIRNTSSHSKNGEPQQGYKKTDFNLNDCQALIDFFKSSIKKHYEWEQYGFQFSDTTNYQDISEFYKEFQNQAYKVEFDCIRDEYIDSCVRDGKLFLFQIYNKDFSPRSTGTPNMHTLYWRGLFEDENLQKVVLKLNGEAEMFFRKHSIERKDWIIHEKNKGIPIKGGSKEDKSSLFPYSIVKDKRYTQDKFFLHIPITLNYQATKVSRFNDAINQAVSANTNVIGIDRGERHLLYFCVINPQGEIIDQGSLNAIQQGAQTIDYQEKLEQRQRLRDVARKSWTSIENIKELKHGYLSQVVHKLSQLIIEHKAIVCLEDLNFGFKKGRFKVEKQVYQKFEKALIDKLNYLVNKQEKNPLRPGHYLNALQLTAPFEKFEKLGKQSGILYYVRADYTSKICPVTGFVNLLKPYYKSVEKSREFFSNFEEIRFNPTTGNFEFAFDYKRTNLQTSLKGCRTRWRVCSHGERLVAKKDDKGLWQPAEIIWPTDKLAATLKNAAIDFASGVNLIKPICEQDSASFYRELMWGLRLTLQMRNSLSNSTVPEDDYLISPAADENGTFYDSRKAKGTGLPEDADANGAYHIALKGLWNIQQITQHDWSVENPRSPKLDMSNEQWFAFAQNKPYKQ